MKKNIFCCGGGAAAEADGAQHDTSGDEMDEVRNVSVSFFVVSSFCFS